jgi:hypothetical protein
MASAGPAFQVAPEDPPQLLMTRIELEGWPVAWAAEAQGSAERPPTRGPPGTARKAGPVWRSGAPGPTRSPPLTPPEQVEAIL